MKLKTKQFYDKSAKSVEMKSGDIFLIKNEPYNKFKNIYSGPFTALKIEDSNVYYEFEGKTKKFHKNRTIRLRKDN